MNEARFTLIHFFIIMVKLQYFLDFYVVRRGNLYMCMGGRYLLIRHCFLK